MPEVHLLILVLGSILLLLRNRFEPAEHPLLPTLPALAIGEPVPLPLAIAAARQHSASPQAPLISLTLSESRRRLRPSKPPSSPTIPLTWLEPDHPSAQALPRALLISPITHRLLVSTHPRFVFCPVPGAAEDSLKHHLSVATTLQPLSAFSVRDRERLLTRADVFRFAFVAHPFSRALAAFYRGTRGPGGVDGFTYRQFMGRVRGQILSEQEREVAIVSLQFFLTFLTRQVPQSLHEDFRSQTALCAFGDFNYSFVGRMERLAADVQIVDRHLGLGHAVVQADAYFREAERDAANVFHHNARLHSKVTKLYEADLRNGGYPSASFP